MKKLRIFLLLACLLAPAAAYGAIAEVGGGSERDFVVTTSGGDDSAPIVLTNGATVGDRIVVGGTAYDAGGPPASIAVTAPCATFTVRSSSSTGVTTQFIADGVATGTGACTVTVNPDGSAGYISAGAAKFTGMGALDVNLGNTNATDLAATSTISTVAANAVIFSVFTQGTDQATITPDGSMTVIAEDDNNTTAQCFSFTYKLATSPGSYDMEWTIDHSVAWRIHTESFAPAGAASASQTRIMVSE